MKLGLIGSGGREHAIADALMRAPDRDQLYVFASTRNPGIERLAGVIQVGRLTDIERIVRFFGSHQVELVVVGPEVPLQAGVVDGLRTSGIPAVGPTGSQARLEGDKSFMRRLMKERVGWGSPEWELVSDRPAAARFIEQVGQVAVKPVGLTGGKGVQVMGVHLDGLDETLAVIDAWIERDGSVLLEERLVGEEFSRMAFVSEGVITPMPVCQDFKYAFDGDLGGMTGGMGAYSCTDGGMPFLQPTDLEQADRLMEETISALGTLTGESYRGFLYGQFMATADGIRVIEYNARLGDPEAINVMSLLEGDVPILMSDLAEGVLDQGQVCFTPAASLCKYLVPEGYPDDPGEPLNFSLDVDLIEGSGFSIVYASVERAGDAYRTLGSRTLAIAGLGESPGQISERMEALLMEVQPPGLRHRQDVGDAGVMQAKIDRMHSIRSVGGC